MYWVILLHFTTHHTNARLFLVTTPISSDSNNAVLGKLWNSVVSEEVLLFILFVCL